MKITLTLPADRLVLSHLLRQGVLKINQFLAMKPGDELMADTVDAVMELGALSPEVLAAHFVDLMRHATVTLTPATQVVMTDVSPASASAEVRAEKRVKKPCRGRVPATGQLLDITAT